MSEYSQKAADFLGLMRFYGIILITISFPFKEVNMLKDFVKVFQHGKSSFFANDILINMIP